MDHAWHIGKSIFKDNPYCRISQQPWILMRNESFIMKPNMGWKAFLRKLAIMRHNKTLCFKFAVTLGIWSLPLPVVSLQDSLANIKAVRQLILLHGFSRLFFFSTTFLLKWAGFPYNEQRQVCPMYISHTNDLLEFYLFLTAGTFLGFLSPANTYWNTYLWHHHADWNSHLNTLLNLRTYSKPNTCLRTSLGSIHILSLRAQQFCFTTHLLTINSQFTCTVSPRYK